MPKTLTEDGTVVGSVDVPVDTDSRTALSVETPFQELTNRTRYALDRLGAEAAGSAAHELTYPDPKTRTLWVPAGAFAFVSGWSRFAGGTGDEGAIASTALGAEARLYLSTVGLPTDAVVDTIDLLWSAAVRSGSDRARCQAKRHQYVDGVTAPNVLTMVPTVFVDGGAVTQVQLTGDITIDRSLEAAFIEVRSGINVGGVDVFYGARITYSDPGPRNF